MSTPRNTRFDNASPAEKRVIIAQHALEWMRLGAIVPTPGLYIRPTGTRLNELAKDYPSKLARDVVLGPCEACIKGALLLVKAELFGEISIGQLDWYIGYDFLEEDFGKHLQRMESAFEQHPRSDMPVPWYDTYPDPAKRYEAILKNVIRNKGTFQINEIVLRASR
jgi:hypothetical protein